MTSITYDRLYSDADGTSCVQKNLTMELSTVDFAPPAPPLAVSAPEPASTYAFVTAPVGFVGDWHPSPKRQWVFYLRGELEYEAGDGTVWRVGPGSYMLTEDTSGRGHRSRVISPTPAVLVVVQLEP